MSSYSSSWSNCRPGPRHPHRRKYRGTRTSGSRATTGITSLLRRLRIPTHPPDKPQSSYTGRQALPKSSSCKSPSWGYFLPYPRHPHRRKYRGGRTGGGRATIGITTSTPTNKNSDGPILQALDFICRMPGWGRNSRILQGLKDHLAVGHYGDPIVIREIPGLRRRRKVIHSSTELGKTPKSRQNSEHHFAHLPTWQEGS